jgi:protein-disulfide isomerase/uncharacterized membrane protein
VGRIKFVVKNAKIALFLLASVGLIASILLTQLHYKVDRNGFDEKSFCNVSEFVDCDTVVASRYSSVKTPFLTVPNSEIGMIYYLLMLLGLGYAGAARHADRRRGTLAFLFVSMIFASAYSVFMAYLSVSKLGVICLMCATTYFVNFLMLLTFPSALGLRFKEVPKFLARYVGAVFGAASDLKPRLVFHLGATLALLGFGLVFFRGVNPAVHKPYVPIPRDMYLNAFEATPVEEIDTAGRPFWGNPNAKVKIVEFSDFQCPFCRRAAFTLKPFLKSYKNDIAFYYLNFPLDSACNALLQQTMHPVACLAAKGGVCAAKQGKFWEYHDQVFENQKRLSRSVLIEVAARVGLDGPSFESCLVSDDAQVAIGRDVEQGGKVHVEGTPSIYINGRLFRDWLDPERVRLVIEAERARPGSPESRRSAESSPAPSSPLPTSGNP